MNGLLCLTLPEQDAKTLRRPYEISEMSDKFKALI